MIEKIMFPVDFSPSCVAMAAYVRRAADIFDSQVALVYVCDLTSSNGFELMVRGMREVTEDHLSVARDRLDSFLPFVNIPPRLVFGFAVVKRRFWKLHRAARFGG